MAAKSLTRLMDNIPDIVLIAVIQQYNNTNIMQVTDKDVYVAIIGYRQCPIMVDANVIPLYGQDYELYFSYIKKGNYKKDYSYDADRNIIMIHFTYEGAG